KTLITVGVDPQVNAMEYFGENPKTQAQLRPVVETVLKIYARAVDEAGKRADAIANKLTPNDNAGIQRWQAADDLRNLAAFSGAMAQYDLCMALDKADPQRKRTADDAIESLKQFDTNDSAVQPVVRNQIAKLNMVKGSFDAAKKMFDAIANNPNGEIKPAPDKAQQYEARYFSVVCQILSRKIADAQKDMEALDTWQRANLTAEQQKGASAAFTMLKYRVLSTRADLANDADDRRKNNEQAIATLMQLLKEQPQYKTVIFQQVLTRMPDNADVAKMDPLLLLALQQQAELEYAKPEGQKLDEHALSRGIDAAREVIRRKAGNGLGAATVARSAYVLPYLLERAPGREKEAAAAFLDYAQSYSSDTKNAGDSLDHATALIGRLRKQDLQDQDTRKLYDRFLPIAINPPFNRKQFAFEYALLLQAEQHYKQAVETFKQVPPDDKRLLTAHFYEMVALKQRLNDDDDKMSADERKSVVAEIQTLADEVNQKAAAAEAAATTPEDKKRYSSMLVRTALLAADLANHEQKDPKRALDLLAGFEEKVKGQPNEQDLLFQALSLRVNSYMELGQTNDATSTLVTLLKTKQGNEGPALVFDLLKKLDMDMEHARAAGDAAEVKQLAENRAALSGFLVTWAENNPDPKIKDLTNRYKAFDASTKQLAAELSDDPAKRKAGLEAALKQYQDLYDANNPDPAVQLGMGFVQYDLGHYKQAKEALGPLVVNKKTGTPTVTITENGEPKTVESSQYWEAILKLVRSIAEVAKADPNDAQAQKDLDAGKVFLKQQYVLWPKTIGGKKYHDDFEKLRVELIPNFHPDTEEPASQPVAGS
ncbi:MAG TPA: hypothetical protein VLI90_12315, partial [Tepidisphaeraceae bacterium]|nr:hypothetical protein [Tepidisphaeraceae bacterium]